MKITRTSKAPQPTVFISEMKRGEVYRSAGDTGADVSLFMRTDERDFPLVVLGTGVLCGNTLSRDPYVRVSAEVVVGG